MGVTSRNDKAEENRPRKATQQGGMLANPKLQLLALPLGLAALIYVGWSLWRGSDSDALATDSAVVWFVDVDGNAYKHRMSLDESEYRNPSTGKPAFKAELCYWTKDGKPKTEPTKVLLNSNIGSDKPTFCPDCSRLVVGHNPTPSSSSGGRAPPTKEEYERSGKR